ncbi:MAG: SagB/ThcOx family dehydrogenase [Candidatus Altiarchaeota archaeon]|nr:SagB/ThcOx family dehydrogenase [Candidatus Altiarchaeota archaeon]
MRISFLILSLIMLSLGCVEEVNDMSKEKPADTVIELPEPSLNGSVSVEEAIKSRRSRREYADAPLRVEEISQILWSAQGITGSTPRYRAAPSAGATNPLELYLIAGDVEGLNQGIYHYNPVKNTLKLKKRGDARESLAEAALNQEYIADAPAVLVFTAAYERTTSKYGDRGIRYVHMEVGHAAQNIYLQCESMNLGTVTVGAFNDTRVKELLNQTEEEPVYIMPVGKI